MSESARRAVVITVSDRSSRGERHDASGPIAVEALRADGWDVADATVVADGPDSVEAALRASLEAGARVIVTTGGTGVAPRDETPEGTARVLEREIPGIAEELRRIGATVKPQGMLTRGLVGVAGSALIANLPGSPNGVTSGMPVILSLASHIVDQLDGHDHP